MPRLASQAAAAAAQPPPVSPLGGGVAATDDDENPLITAINARRTGSMSRADMMQQLVAHSSSWDRSAAAARAVDQQRGGPGGGASGAAAAARAAPTPAPAPTSPRSAAAAATAASARAERERQREAARAATAQQQQEEKAARRAQLDAARARKRTDERAAAEARALARSEEARAQAQAAVLPEQERIRQQAEQANAARLAEAARARQMDAERLQAGRIAEVERAHAVELAAVQEEARAAATAEAESKIARIRQREQRAEAARRVAEKEQAAAQEQIEAALAEAERERARARKLERDRAEAARVIVEHEQTAAAAQLAAAQALAETDRIRKLEEQSRADLARLQEQQALSPLDDPADFLRQRAASSAAHSGSTTKQKQKQKPSPRAASTAALRSATEPEPEPEPELDLKLAIELEPEPEPEPWQCSWCTDPNVLPVHRMPGPTSAAELCPACGVQFEALDVDDAGGEEEEEDGVDEPEVTVDPRLFKQAPRLLLQRATMDLSGGSLEQESELWLEEASSLETKPQNPIALRSSSPTGGRSDAQWRAWSTHSNNSTSSLAVKPVPRQPPPRFVSPRASERAKSPRAADGAGTAAAGARTDRTEPSIRELKRMLFDLGLDSTGSRKELLQRYQEAQRRRKEEQALQAESRKKSAKKQKSHAAQLAVLSPRAKKGRAQAITVRKEVESRRTETAFSPRRQAQGSPRRQGRNSSSPRKSKKKPSKAARNSAKIYDRHHEELQKEIERLGLEQPKEGPRVSLAQVREKKREDQQKETEAAEAKELAKRSVHSKHWRKEAAKDTALRMKPTAYGSEVQSAAESVEDPEERGRRMHAHAKRYEEKREALEKRAEEQAAAQVYSFGTFGAKSKKLVKSMDSDNRRPDRELQLPREKRHEGRDMFQHRGKQKVEALKSEASARETPPESKKIADGQRAEAHEKLYNDALRKTAATKRADDEHSLRVTPSRREQQRLTSPARQSKSSKKTRSSTGAGADADADADVDADAVVGAETGAETEASRKSPPKLRGGGVQKLSLVLSAPTDSDDDTLAATAAEPEEAPISPRAAAETISPLPSESAAPKGSEQPEHPLPQRGGLGRLRQRRSSEVLAEDIAKLENLLPVLKDDVTEAAASPQSAKIASPKRKQSGGGGGGGKQEAVSESTGSPSKEKKKQVEKTRKKGAAKAAGGAGGGKQTGSPSDKKTKQKKNSGKFSPRSSRKSPRSPSLEEERAAMTAKVDAEMRVLEELTESTLKVIDMLPQEQRQVERDHVLAHVERAPANFGSPQPSPRKSGGGGDASRVEQDTAAAAAAAAAAVVAEADIDHEHDEFLSQLEELEDFVATSPRAAAALSSTATVSPGESGPEASSTGLECGLVSAAVR
jgi:hypothetical protein